MSDASPGSLVDRSAGFPTISARGSRQLTLWRSTHTVCANGGGSMSAIQIFRLEDAVLPQRAAGGSHRGRGVNGQDGGALELRRYPIETGLPGLNISLTYGSVNNGFFS